MSDDTEFENVDIKIEKIEDVFSEEKLIIDNVKFENQPAVIKEESVDDRMKSCGTNEKMRESIVEKMLSKNYRPKQIYASNPTRDCFTTCFLKQLTPKHKLKQNPNSNLKSEQGKKFKLKNNVNSENKEYLNSISIENRQKMFESIYKDSIPPPKLPSQEWGFHRMEKNGKRSLVYTELGMFIAEAIVPQIRKLVIFDELFNSEVYIYDRLVLKKELYKKSLNFKTSLELFLREVHHYKLCLGGPPASKYANLNFTYAVEDSFGILRAKNCRMLIGCNKESNICESCLRLEESLNQHMELLR